MRKSRTLAINALLATLIVIFTFIPMMPIGVSLAALMLLPVIIAGQIERFGSALFAGTFLGIMSLISSFVMPTPIAPVFHNPIISILPRMCVGVVAWLVYNGINKLMRKKCKQGISHTVAATMSAACAVITNTGLVLSMIWAFYNGKTVGETAITPEFMMGLISVNFIIELVVSVLLAPPISFALNKTVNKNKKLIFSIDEINNTNTYSNPDNDTSNVIGASQSDVNLGVSDYSNDASNKIGVSQPDVQNDTSHTTNND